MTAADAHELWADAVLHAVGTLRRLMDDPDRDRALTACVEVMKLECARVRHGRPIAGIEGAEEDPRDSGRDTDAGAGEPDFEDAADGLRYLLGLPPDLAPAEYERFGLS